MKVTQEFLKSSLSQCLEKQNTDESSLGNTQRSLVLSILSKSFTSWCSEGRILPIGSYKLGVHSADSDMDLVCLAPLRYPRHEFQQDFYLRVQSLPEVNYCYGIFRAKVPLIKLIIQGIRIDLQYANTDQDLSSFRPELLDEATLLSLNAYKNNELLLSLVPNVDNFRGLLRTVRLWAKKRGVYSGILGFLGGAAWALLCAKICILYPSVSEVELVRNFFKVYSQWDWTVPVCLDPEQSAGFEYSSHQALMSVLTPAYPSYNAAYTLTSSAFCCIVQELELAYKIVKDIAEGNLEWGVLFEEIDFFQQYRHLIKVCIQAGNCTEYETWQGLVFSRVRYLMQELEYSYPQPIVVMYSKAFDTHKKYNKFSQTFYIGLSFNCAQGFKADLRMPLKNFCSMLNELRPNKTSMSLRITYIPRKDLSFGEKQILKS